MYSKWKMKQTNKSDVTVTGEFKGIHSILKMFNLHSHYAINTIVVTMF